MPKPFSRIRRTGLFLAIAVAIAAPSSAMTSVGAQEDPLGAGFRAPPNSARPRVWWHWMNGNVTKDGIRKDMEWMSRVGIGGLQNFDAALLTPQIVDKRLVYMTPEWKDAFRYAAGLADGMGLELAVAASPGWSETGGPWVQPKDGLKKLVWSEAVVDGGRPLVRPLPSPPSTTGPFQGLHGETWVLSVAKDDAKAPPPSYYADVKVLAFPDRDGQPLPAPRISVSGGEPINAAKLLDDDLESSVEVASSRGGEPTSILIEYPSSQTVRSASIFLPGAAGMFAAAAVQPQLEASNDDGATWRKVTEVALSTAPTTVSFPPVTARLFRLRLTASASAGKPAGNFAPAPGAVIINLHPGGEQKQTVRIADLRLSSAAKVNQFEVKAGFGLVDDYYAIPGDKDVAAAPEPEAVAPETVIDLTDRLRPDGRLDWTPPPGRWKVIRLGFSLLGTTNHPATPEATGLEVDKFDGAAVRSYLETYLGMYADTTGPDLIGAHGLRALVTDSIEVGAANWTPRMVEQFKRLRGYDPTPWMPALAGTVVESRARSDAFLYDYRRTLADLIASEHYGQVAAVAHEHGLKVYGEALEAGRPSIGDDMDMRSFADVPMSALWTYRERGPNPVYLADMKGAASVAHVYGQNLVAAESLTSALSPWAFAPADLKPIIDLEFATGVNRPVIHTSVHQPVDDKLPGLSLMIFGQYFNRHETWAEMARPWVDYISRTAYLLQQGRNLADVGYFYGEEAPLTGLYHFDPVADAPTHYAYDFINAKALGGALSVDRGEVVSSGGARYRVIYLGGSSRHMTLPTLKRLGALVEAGATVVGDAPQSSPSLADDPAAFAAEAVRLWAGGAVTRLGKGRVIAGHDVEAALASIGVTPDLSLSGAAPDSHILFVHRRLTDGDIYFLNNRNDRAERVEATFRVTGRQPEIWRADIGAMEPVSYRIEDGRTVVSLDILPRDAFFVVFRKPTTAQAGDFLQPAERTIATLDQGWDVSFQPGRGAPAEAQLATLQPLNQNSDPAIRYFSGTATYRASFHLPALQRQTRLKLDLGKVGDVAEVLVNGHAVGIAWKPPYQVDITAAVKPGENQLEVRVADLWVNRLIGDAQPGVKQKITFTTLPTYRPDAPLRPSGLIGPVTLVSEVQAPAPGEGASR